MTLGCCLVGVGVVGTGGAADQASGEEGVTGVEVLLVGVGGRGRSRGRGRGRGSSTGRGRGRGRGC